MGIAQTKKLPIKASFVDARNNRTHFSPKKRVFACAISSFVFIIFFPFFNTPGCRYSGNRRGAKKIARFPPLDCLIPPLPYDVFQGKHSLFPFISSPRPPFFGRNQKKIIATKKKHGCPNSGHGWPLFSIRYQKRKKKKTAKKLWDMQFLGIAFSRNPIFPLSHPFFSVLSQRFPRVSDRRKKKVARNKHPACRFSCLLNSNSKLSFGIVFWRFSYNFLPPSFFFC